MIGLVVDKEWRTLWRDRRLLLLGASLLAVLIGVWAASDAASRAARAERETVGATARAQWERQGVKHPHRAAHFGIYAFRPGGPLTAIDPGIGSQVGQSLWLEPHKRNLARHRPAIDEAPSPRLGHALPAFVLIVLVPLLIIGLGHDTITQEREAGTLRMLYGAGVSPRALLFGKWLALLLTVSAVLLPVLLVGIGTALAGADAAAGPAGIGIGENVARGLSMIAALLAYYAVFTAITVAVSARMRTSRAALLALLAFWIGSVWIVPRLGAGLADRWVDLPTGEAFHAAIAADIRDGLPGDGDAATRVAAFEATLLRDHGVTRLEDLPQGAFAARRLFRDAYANRVHALHFDRLWERYAAQRRLLRGAGAASPMLPVRAVSMAAAGTDLAHQRHFEDAAERYRERFTVQIDEWDRQATRGLVSYEDKYAGDALWQSVPPFDYRPPSPAFAWREAAPDAVALIVWLIGSLAWLGASARKVTP